MANVVTAIHRVNHNLFIRAKVRISEQNTKKETGNCHTEFAKQAFFIFYNTKNENGEWRIENYFVTLQSNSKCKIVNLI